MNQDASAVDVRREMLDLRLQLVISLPVLRRVISLETLGVDELDHMRLERSDRAADVLDASVEVDDLLSRAVLVERARLGALLRLLPELIDGHAVLRGGAFVVSEELFIATSTRH